MIRTEWGEVFVVVMMYGLKTTIETFERVIQEIFTDYILAFMQFFLEDFVAYGRREDHFDLALTQLTVHLT